MDDPSAQQIMKNHIFFYKKEGVEAIIALYPIIQAKMEDEPEWMKQYIEALIAPALLDWSIYKTREHLSKLRGSTDFLYYWHDKYGFVHISDREKILESYEQFKKARGLRIIMCSSSAPKRDFLRDLYEKTSLASV